MNLDSMNEMLFRQLERLAKEDLTKDELETEIDRAKAMAITSSQIISSCTLQMRRDLLKVGNTSDIKLLEG